MFTDRRNFAAAQPQSQMLPRSLKQNFSWTFAGNIAQMLAQFGMLFVLARVGTDAMVGQYGLGLAITAPIFLFTGMSLRSVQVTDIPGEYRFAEYALVRLISLIIGMVIVVTIVSWLDYSAETTAVVLLLAVSKMVDGMSDIIFGVFQKHEQMDLIARSMIVKAGSTFVVFALMLAATGSVVWGVASISVVWLIRLITFDLVNLSRMQGSTFKPRRLWSVSMLASRSALFNHQVLGSLVIISLPMGLASSLVSLNSSLPRFVLEWSGGLEELGVFTVLAYLLVAGNTVMSALAQAILPRLTKLYATSAIGDIRVLVAKLMTMGFVLAIVALALAILVGNKAVGLVFGSQYTRHEAALIVLVLGMGIGFGNWILNAAIQAARQFSALLRLQVLATLLTVLVSLVLIPNFGIVGAAWTLVASALFQVVTKSILVTKYLQGMATRAE